MLAWLLTITLVVFAHSEPSVNDVQEERWDPDEMASSPALDINDNVSRHFWGCRGGCCKRSTACHRILGGKCLKGDALSAADCDFVAPGNECSRRTNCSCCIKCSDSGRCLANGGQCQSDRECPPNAYIDVFSPCRSSSACVCCQNCTQTQECVGGENNDTGLCTGNADNLLRMDEYYSPSTSLTCENTECNCILKCGGASCEGNGGFCIKGEECPPGFENNATADICGCNNNSICKCCLPVNSTLTC
ncbi:hypothetical protein Pcinc_002105 [Petrolisthes cinctipes]|uniref:Uncharacterized protein n=2 Tax=Petrolisthes cinctipes TaxID=88211 RepID=A0AAE1GLL4_PETCI|nr:hypothetical protein Pcinc_002105 [Petrolisthes cinctipes]